MLELLVKRFNGRLTVTLAEAATLLPDMHEETAKRLARSGSFPGAIKIGGRWVVSLPAFARQLEPAS